MDTTEIEQPITVETSSVSCDGGSGAAGHPNVYLNIGKERQVVCPYCSRQFVLAEGASGGSGH
ncbi:MAG: zinc-finger domain-containing protein [Rhodospirillaceae bacterium]|jgi:uncharacterized Zn-finger protein|nr:zinc-finger domain-containing protein [Rhodospirillaceae bacterium]MBT4588128.1 zinc-finger domain-containing protein [Rhodospirillaceae bacterium]MBT4937596.1 zinc-finger domain-containing protein [Rhodospirillaceae bacterium]MBT5940621.1 zinc-finger domain-containing protein [Rhodospirillaceae bacterium]MBT7266798.1 zinc-finger domain-containing protein [Rhodospirillaceae bacterium]